jgi:hypothetical protein
VEFRNFGVFAAKVRKARIGRNPHQPAKDVPISQRVVVTFKPGKEMRVAVSKSSPPVIQSYDITFSPANRQIKDMAETPKKQKEHRAQHS